VQKTTRESREAMLTRRFFRSLASGRSYFVAQFVALAARKLGETRVLVGWAWHLNC
jgi:hypothetical protein